jgi:hypothetical protein
MIPPRARGDAALPAALLLAALACLTPPTAAAQDTTWNRYTLEDLGGVFVRFEATEVCVDAGATAAAFEAAISLRLMEADVGVLTREEMLANRALPELRVSLECARGAGGDIAFSVGLRLQQAAQMLRDTQITLPEAVTWYDLRMGIAPAAETAAAIESHLMEAVGGFAAAWAAVNATESASGN